ncbi:MAG: hypothetical protein HY512_02960, partial [Candidatus Aenigmarchaeota archaeon]|nr:hypothetical protein [Candidatus Aenigmarchaeota archaeon]
VVLLPERLFDLERIREGSKPLDLSHVEQWVQLGIIEKVGKTSLTYSNSIDRNNSIASSAKITVVFVGPKGRPVEIPDDVRKRLKGCVDTQIERYDDFGAPIKDRDFNWRLLTDDRLLPP